MHVVSIKHEFCFENNLNALSHTRNMKYHGGLKAVPGAHSILLPPPVPPTYAPYQAFVRFARGALNLLEKLNPFSFSAEQICT